MVQSEMRRCLRRAMPRGLGGEKRSRRENTTEEALLCSWQSVESSSHERLPLFVPRHNVMMQ